ncbi:MAG: hypothetical protein ACLFS8_04675 [Clostridia bacterium]
MLKDRVVAVIFEGGNPRSDIEVKMSRVRKGVALDNMTKALDCPDIDGVILSTNFPDLGARAAEIGAQIDATDRDFHFGRHLSWVVEEFGLDNVIYFGGAALPLMRIDDLTWVARRLKELKNVVVVNNAQSADLTAFTPASIIRHIDPPEADNFLGYLLREAGLRRVLIENSARINLDVDTPSDLMVLNRCRGVGPETRRALDEIDLPANPLDDAIDVFSRREHPYPEVALIGRVGPAMMSVINANLPIRLRVFSEERGMKALRREAREEAISLIGFLIEELGPQKFFEYLGRICDLAIIDTRVLFAHLKLFPSAPDRFYSDLGMVERIGDPFIRRFTSAAGEAPIPVVLGGHSMVYGGLWALLDENGLLENPIPGIPGRS